MIGSSEWLDGASVDAAIWERWPEYRVWLVTAEAVDASALAATADELFQQAVESVTAEAAAEHPGDHVILWQQTYRDFGVKPRVARPSVDTLLRRAASEHGLPRINVLVDLYNAISILDRVPIGGEDLEPYDGPPRLTLATGAEPFQTTSHGEPHVDCAVPGEPVWIDEAGITCRRWNWRQTTRTAIQPATTRVGFIVDSLDGPDHRGAQRAVERLAGMLPHALVRTISPAGN